MFLRLNGDRFSALLVASLLIVLSAGDVFCLGVGDGAEGGGVAPLLLTLSLEANGVSCGAGSLKLELRRDVASPSQPPRAISGIGSGECEVTAEVATDGRATPLLASSLDSGANVCPTALERSTLLS